MRRLRELNEGQPVAGIIRIQQVASEGEQLAAVLRLPIVVEGVEFFEPAPEPADWKAASFGVTQICPPHNSRAICIICGRFEQANMRPA